ncbi:hypothetical protein CDAR_235021 [Caerostris darwini]|uniref:Ig-like domain-containing protein n=1 Tax=Caerostris darwini TaxID=1538125 RepID=A0AAV4VWH0_9ARAC|nr:hypothetical protein CDAR_235021 [Caerostris darwini]
METLVGLVRGRSWLQHCCSGILQQVSLSLAAIRMLMMDVPSPTNHGESVELICSYELDEDKLYSVKWYKDDVEFYRYVPNDWPPGQFLPLQGVRVDVSKIITENVIRCD